MADPPDEPSPNTAVRPASEPRQALRSCAERARTWLFEHALPIWWERGYDRRARCFYERLDLDGSPIVDEPRRVRVQARQTIV